MVSVVVVAVAWARMQVNKAECLLWLFSLSEVVITPIFGTFQAYLDRFQNPGHCQFDNSLRRHFLFPVHSPTERGIAVTIFGF
jgi:hypothetical protein